MAIVRVKKGDLAKANIDCRGPEGDRFRNAFGKWGQLSFALGRTFEEASTKWRALCREEVERITPIMGRSLAVFTVNVKQRRVQGNRLDKFLPVEI